MVTLESIKETFKQMVIDGINPQKELLWGYFFTNKTRESLEELSKELNEKDFKEVVIRQDDNGLFWLSVEKMGIHTPESLFALCEKFYKLALDRQLESFDGYDVEV